jgi:hypothetical protein
MYLYLLIIIAIEREKWKILKKIKYFFECIVFRVRASGVKFYIYF